jgi:hypothetical protein
VNVIDPFAHEGAELRENWRTTRQALDELDVLEVVPGQGAVAAGAAFVASVATGMASVELPKAATPLWCVQRLRRPSWRRAILRITTTYTATVGSTANFRLTVRLRETTTGDAYPVAAALDVNFLLPGPAVADTEKRYVYASPTVALPGAKPNLNLIILRDSAHADDANANSLHLISMLWEILPE